MIGRFADLFRLAWGLLYWNVRKSWFRTRRGRSPVPCQSPSDSGRAYQTACDACLSWSNPENFRRVCPLLVKTPEGLRCSVNSPDVRPFWGRAFAIYGGTIAACYLILALGAFTFLRSVGYPINLGHLVWPGKWHRVMEVRGWFFMERANQAFAAGRPAEGMLYLANAHEFDPANFDIAFALAQKTQVGQASRSDEIYRRLLANHPEQRAIISESWYRALLARGDFAAIIELSSEQVVQDQARAGVWLRALLFACRQTAKIEPLRQLLASDSRAVNPWRRVLETELLLRTSRHPEARRQLIAAWDDAPAFAKYYQISELIALGEGIAAVDLIGKYSSAFDDVARVTLLLEAYARLGVQQQRQRLAATILAGELKTPAVSVLAAHLIRHPDPEILNQLFARFTRANTELSDQTLEAFLALYCTAGAARDVPKMRMIGSFLAQHGEGSRFTLSVAGAFFRGETPLTRVSAILPALPVSLEVSYALLERYPGPRQPADDTSA